MNNIKIFIFGALTLVITFLCLNFIANKHSNEFGLRKEACSQEAIKINPACSYLQRSMIQQRFAFVSFMTAGVFILSVKENGWILPILFLFSFFYFIVVYFSKKDFSHKNLTTRCLKHNFIWSALLALVSLTRDSFIHDSSGFYKNFNRNILLKSSNIFSYVFNAIRSIYNRYDDIIASKLIYLLMAFIVLLFVSGLILLGASLKNKKFFPVAIISIFSFLEILLFFVFVVEYNIF